MSDQEWLASVRPGDDVVLMVDDEPRALDTAVEVTQSKIMANHIGTFHRDNGYFIGRGERNIRIGEPTAERLQVMRVQAERLQEQVKRRELLDKIYRNHWAELSTDTLRQVVELISADSHTQAPR